MGIRQYIGARYVMKIYQNSVDPSTDDWEANMTYEPLTLVNYNGSSYISRKEVLPSVGDPASNPTYWAFFGSFSGQLTQLRQEVDALNLFAEKFNTVQNRKFIFFGDSYGINYTDGGVPITGWLDNVVNILGLTASQYAGSFVQSGYGFLANNNPWLTPLTALTDDDEVTDVVFVGGHNDDAYAVNDPQFETYIINTINTAKTKFPNAKIWIGYCNIETTYNTDIKKCYKIYSRVAVKNGATFMDGLEYCLFDQTLWQNHAHPNNEGSKIMAGAMASILTGGGYYNGMEEQIVTYDSTAPGIQATSHDDLYFSVESNHVSIVGRHISDPASRMWEANFGATGINVKANLADLFLIDKMTNLPVMPDNTGSDLGSCGGLAVYNVSGTVTVYPATIHFHMINGYLGAYVLALNAAGNYVNAGGTDKLLTIRCALPKFVVDLLRK